MRVTTGMLGASNDSSPCRLAASSPMICGRQDLPRRNAHYRCWSFVARL